LRISFVHGNPSITFGCAPLFANSQSASNSARCNTAHSTTIARIRGGK
jgi:hypothetical protein